MTFRFDGIEEAQSAAAEGAPRATGRDQPLDPVQQRGGRATLRLDIDRLEPVHRIHDRRQIQTRRIRPRKPPVAIERPLHRRAHAVAIAQKDIVPHPDLVAVIEDRRARHRDQKYVEQLDLAAVVLHQRREPASDPEVQPRLAIGGIMAPQVVPLAIGHHLERQLVVVAQEHRPLARVRDVRRLAHDVGDRVPILGRDRHVDPRHQREVECHVAFVACAEILQHILRPLIGLGEQHAVGVMRVELAAQPLQKLVSFGQVLVDRPLALDQVGHRIEPHPVDPEIEPEPHHVDDRAEYSRIVEVEIGLMRIKPVPVIGLRHRIPRPV